ncbi:sensor domain-containing diguanylate cyclase [Buttiauxella noackiae]|uniref:sensor domain-containing diguanylate cyclase n=1 Tax=Buttiauxella noackiae TaxID=82992 RepID=UPI00055347E2|nr:sensor domain-containing diguanylate cyclase [Buttiauxella noackiae]
MLKLTSRKALILTVFVLIAPFVLISTYSFFYIKVGVENNFNETMFRFTKNTAYASIETPVRKINAKLNAMAGMISKEDIAQYISPEHSELNSLLPSLIISNEMFSSILLSDSQDRYRVYPHKEYQGFKPSERPWFPTDGVKNTIYYSDPYVGVSKSPTTNKHVLDVTVSMNLFDRKSDFVGNIALDLDLNALSNILKGLTVPYNGRFKVAAMDGSIIMYANTKEIFAQKIPESWLKEIKETSGSFNDNENNQIVFYQTYQNPDWVALSTVSYDNYNKLLNNAYLALIYIILGCLICYLIVAIIIRMYFKQWVDVLYLSINENTPNETPRNLENLCKGIAKKNETLKEAVEAATTDPLTKIGSRRKFDQDVLNLFHSRVPFHLAMIDLDNFKKINDTWGHQTGDCVLQNVSKAGVERFGGKHDIYRFGGEELVALIYDLPFNECYELIDSWRYTVTKRKWREQGMLVSFSCGIASSMECSSIDELVATADKLLYQAKESGKNCIYPPIS